MPVTETPYPILSHFFCSVLANTGMPPQPLDATLQQQASVAKTETSNDADNKAQPLPKGMILGPDGKP